METIKTKNRCKQKLRNKPKLKSRRWRKLKQNRKIENIRYDAEYREERLVISVEENVGGLKTVTTDKDRVLRDGWTEIKLQLVDGKESGVYIQYIHLCLTNEDT